METGEKIYVAGHQGMVGSAILKKLEEKGYSNIVLRSRRELDLLDQSAVSDFFQKEQPDWVFFAAGKTGGIYANNTYRADFLYENIVMQGNVIHQAFLNGAQKLLFPACSCIFPKNCLQPMKEEHVLTGALEPTNEPFAIAKIAGLKMCEAYNRQYGTDFITVIPTNLYGPNQRYEPMNSLVVPSLLEKFHHAKISDDDQVSLWGTGRPTRDFLFVDDLAIASIFLMENYEGNVIVNVGTGREYSIKELAEVIRSEVGFEGTIEFDPSLPDGVDRKLQDVTRINELGWEYSVDLKEGIHLTYEDYLLRATPSESRTDDQDTDISDGKA
jgi:GDP-L-fucose synthase